MINIIKLNIKNGIIQNDALDGVPVIAKIIEAHGKKNVRTLKKMTEVIGITNHNTANSSPAADAAMHAKYLQNVENADKAYISVHLFVDDEKIVQTVPLDEVTYHAGDSKGDGNYKTISIEICENGDIAKAEENAKKLNAALLLTYPNLKIYKHQDWSGKFCPRRILSRPNGWQDFVDGVNGYVKKADAAQTDIPDWGIEPVEFMTKNKITDGKRLLSPVTRLEAIVLLYRTIKYIFKVFGKNI